MIGVSLTSTCRPSLTPFKKRWHPRGHAIIFGSLESVLGTGFRKECNVSIRLPYRRSTYPTPQGGSILDGTVNCKKTIFTEYCTVLLAFGFTGLLLLVTDDSSLIADKTKTSFISSQIEIQIYGCES